MMPLDKDQVRQETLSKLAVLADNVNTHAARLTDIYKKNAFALDSNGKPDLMIDQNISVQERFNSSSYTTFQKEVDKAFKAGILSNEERANRVGEAQLLDNSVYRPRFAWVVLDTAPAVVSPLPLLPEILVYPPSPNRVTGEPLIPKAAIDAAIKTVNTVQVKPSAPITVTAPVFVSSATFKAGTNKAANAKGAQALAAAAKKAAATAKLTPAQVRQLMGNVADAVKGNTTSGNNSLARPKAPRTAGGKPISRPAGSNTIPVTGGPYPLPNGKGVGRLPQGAVSSPTPGCFKDKGGNTFCV